MELKQKLADLRKGKGLTQLELAEMLSVSRQAISRWEVGTAVPTLDNLVALSNLYHVPLDYLVHDKVEKPSKAPEEAGRPQTKPRRLIKRAALALCLIAAGALMATAAWQLYQNYQVRKAVERAVVVDVDGIRIITDNPQRFQNDPDDPHSYSMNPDGTYEDYSLTDSYQSLLDQITTR